MMFGYPPSALITAMFGLSSMQATNQPPGGPTGGCREKFQIVIVNRIMPRFVASQTAFV